MCGCVSQGVELQSESQDRALAVERLTLRLQEQQQRLQQLGAREAAAQEQLVVARRDAEELDRIVVEK